MFFWGGFNAVSGGERAVWEPAIRDYLIKGSEELRASWQNQHLSDVNGLMFVYL